MTLRRLSWQWLAPLLILLVALVPRAASLGTFVTADESMWLERSIWFVTGVAQDDDAALWRSVYGDTIGAPASALPGLLPMPLPLVGLGTTAFLSSALGGPVPGQYAYAETMEVLGYTAWFTALVTSLSVVVVYWLLCALWGRWPAFLAALVLALDPYFVGLSRVVGVDALLSSFALLAALTLIRVATCEDRRVRALIQAGVWTLLALLTKLPALFLLPFAGVTLVYGAVSPSRENWRARVRFLAVGLVWMPIVLALGLALLALVWPSPDQVLEILARAVSAGVTQAHEGGSYAFGTPGRPLDASFYIWVLALRTTPLTLVGLALAVVAAVAAWRRWREPQVGTVLLLAVYLVAFTIMMTLGAKKQDRYILPALLALDLLAAWGWWGVLRWGFGRVPRLRDRADRWALGVGAVLLLLTTPFWLRLHPYTLAAYNPLLGGSRTAAWVYAVGWGEGLDQVAAYLRATHRDPADVVVASHMAQSLGAEFSGFVVPLTTDTQFVADYVVFYYADALRNVPEPWVIDRFRSRPPDHIAWIDQVPYAGLYANPDLPIKLISRRAPTPSHPLDVTLGRAIACVGYDVRPSPGDASTITGTPGKPIPLTLYWACRVRAAEDYRVFVHLMDREGRTWGQWDDAPLTGRFVTTLWQPGMFLRDDVLVSVGADAPAGTYTLHVGLYNAHTYDRLSVQGVGAEDDHFVIGPIVVQ